MNEKNNNIPPVFVLIRTSNRPNFFTNMIESVKKQTYENIITIIHTDDPKDEEYVAGHGDIYIKSKLNKIAGPGYYNLYCNKLLDAIPDNKEGWFHFIDDDDMYYESDVIEKLVKNSKKDHINIGRSMRWNGKIWPKNWGDQKSYQTECFFIHTDYKNLGRWWNKRGGDHHYSRQITDVLPINWIDDLIICRAQVGKGYGKRFDLDEQKQFMKAAQQRSRISSVGARNKDQKKIKVKFLRRVKGASYRSGKAGEIKYIPEKYVARLIGMGRVEVVDDNIFKKKVKNN